VSAAWEVLRPSYVVASEAVPSASSVGPRSLTVVGHGASAHPDVMAVVVRRDAGLEDRAACRAAEVVVGMFDDGAT
jgi:hypothetical protein